MRTQKQHTPEIALLIVPETTPTAVFGLYEVFWSVGSIWESLTGEKTGIPQVSVKFVAKDLTPFPTAMGLQIQPQSTLNDADIIIVTDLLLTPEQDPRGRWREEVRWLRERYEAGAIICSVCTGALLLAETGLLDGKTATTHWAVADTLKMLHPDINVAPERILTACGLEDRIVTGGGSASWEDLALYLVARLCGKAEAVRISKIFLFGDRTEGQLPYAGARRANRHEDATIAKTQEWIADNYHLENPVARMIAYSGLPDRTFKRRFKAGTGFTPLDYVQSLRIEEAKQMLESEAMHTDNVAAAVGYEDPAFFRRLFKRITGVTPSRYRQRYADLAKIAE